MPDTELLFILGRGRSGTTLLRSLLDRHPAISIAPESQFILHCAPRYRGKVLEGGRIPAFVRDVWTEPRMMNWALTPEGAEAALDAAAPLRFQEACRLLYEAQAKATGKNDIAVIGDKNPVYSLFCDELMDLFPQARFILMTRDPRANVASFLDVPFDSRTVTPLACRWDHYNRSVLDALGDSERFMRVRYEDLVTEPGEILDAVCRYLGVAEADEMQQGTQFAETGAVSWHTGLGRELDPGRLTAWQQRLSTEDVAVIEAVCGEIMARLGYERREAAGSGRPSIPGRMRGRIRTSLERAVFSLPLWLRAWVFRRYRRSLGLL